MILAAGLTPAWQQIVVVEALRVGGVNRAREVRWCSSGKVTNVGLALCHLGGAHEVLTVVGGSSGEQIEAELDPLGLASRLIRTASRTRICTTVIDTNAGVSTELVENAAPLGPRELEAFRAAYDEKVAGASHVVLSGSLPQGTPSDFYRDLIERTPCPVILDARGEELRAALSSQPYLVKPNRDELGTTLGRRVESPGETLEAMSEINRLGAEWVVVTHGAEVVLARSRDATFALTPVAVETVNPIGCGDCFAGALAWSLESGEAMKGALRFAVAAAAENAAALLPSRLDLERVRALAARVEVREV